MTVVAKDERFQIERLALGPFGTNAYILKCLKTGASVVVDAPAEAGRILETLKGSDPQYILITHAHADHFGALSALKEALGVPVAAHAADAGRLPVPPDLLSKEGDTVSCGQIRLRVLHTPGHTPGGLCFVTGLHLLSGDTLFPGGPGKTWSAEDFKRILEAITTKLFTLPDDTQFYPGHGEGTLLAREKKAYEGFASRPHDAGLFGDVLWASS